MQQVLPERDVPGISAKHCATPTINLVNQDFDAGCDLDYCANTARKLEINAVASNSFGFGGTNGTLVFKRYED